MTTFPSDEAEFIDLMERVDADLKTERVSIVSRPMRGLGLVAKSLKMGFDLPTSGEVPTPGNYTGQSLAIRVMRWFDGRYGDRLLTDLRLGRVAVRIKGDPWEMCIPRAYGDFDYVCPAHRRPVKLPQDNILALVRDLPDGLACALTEEDRSIIRHTFRVGLSFFIRTCGLQHLPLVEEAKRDHDGAVHHLILDEPNPGQARWGHLQFVEKIYKAYIRDRGSPFPETHDLKKLQALAEKWGAPRADPAWIQAAICSADVRYGDEPSTTTQAIDAEIGALEIGNVLLPAFPSHPRQTQRAASA